MIDETDESDEIVFEDPNYKKILARKEMNQKKIMNEITDIMIRRERIKNVFTSDYGGLKLGSSVWSEENLFENTKEGRIFSMSTNNLKTIIDFHTNPKDIILDPFAGYLNSAETILKMERGFVGYETVESYYLKLKNKLDNLKNQRLTMDLPTENYEIYNKDSTYMNKKTVDMVLTTLPEPVFPERKTREMALELYSTYLKNITQPLMNAYDNLKEGGFMVIHFKDSVRGFFYLPVFLDIENILREFPLKYTLILNTEKPTAIRDDILYKLYMEQTFPYTHQYVFCYYKGKGGL